MSTKQVKTSKLLTGWEQLQSFRKNFGSFLNKDDIIRSTCFQRYKVKIFWIKTMKMILVTFLFLVDKPQQDEILICLGPVLALS